MTFDEIPTRLPDFIIGGAPKCGTSTIHSVLAARSEIGMPEQEIHFFDADDPITHPDFFRLQSGNLCWYDNADAQGEFVRAYADQFLPFQQRQLIGEDSTTYLFSEVAPERIRRLLPDVRLIFAIRDPVQRAYSQYWHLVTTGRTTVSFENAISDQPSLVLGSTFAQPLRRYFELFGSKQVKVVVFRDLVANMQDELDLVADFLAIERQPVQRNTWTNRTRYPASLPLTLALNRVSRRIAAGRYVNHLGAVDSEGRTLADSIEWRWRTKVVARTLRRDKAPPMKPETRAYLEQHLSERNRGLGDLLERDMREVWPWFQG